MIVVDTNVIAYFHLPSEYNSVAQEAFQLDPQWLAPSLWKSEFRNLLSIQIRKGHCSLAEAMEKMLEAEEITTEVNFESDSKQILNLASSSGCTAYDCEFVAAAKNLGVPLVTMDSQILKAFPEIAISLVGFASPPSEAEDPQE